MQRLRRDCKGAGEAVSAERARAVEGETELLRARRRAEEAERNLRDVSGGEGKGGIGCHVCGVMLWFGMGEQVHQECDRVKEDLRRCRLQLAASEERGRRCQLELEVLRERAAANRAAERVRSAGSSSSPTRKGRGGEEEDRGRDLYRDTSYATGTSAGTVRRASSTPASASSYGRGDRTRVSRQAGTPHGWTGSGDRHASTEGGGYAAHLDSTVGSRATAVLRQEYPLLDSDSDSLDAAGSSNRKDWGASRGERGRDRSAALSSRSQSAAAARSLKARENASDDEALGDISRDDFGSGERRRQRSESPPSTVGRSKAGGGNVDVSLLTPNGAKLQYGRLQKMYERVTGLR